VLFLLLERGARELKSALIPGVTAPSTGVGRPARVQARSRWVMTAGASTHRQFSPGTRPPQENPIAHEAFDPLLIQQVGHEFAASHQYIAVAVWFDNQDLLQLARHFYRQSLKERNHAMMIGGEFLRPRELRGPRTGRRRRPRLGGTARRRRSSLRPSAPFPVEGGRGPQAAGSKRTSSNVTVTGSSRVNSSRLSPWRLNCGVWRVARRV
jgi:hypothetical protein